MNRLKILVRTIAPLFLFIPLSMQDTSIKAQAQQTPTASSKQNPVQKKRLPRKPDSARFI